jgi:hypothetical protein
VTGRSSERAELERIDALFELMSGFVQHQGPLAGEHLEEQANAHFLASSRQSALERIDIYREQFWLRHSESLSEDFPGTRALLGPDWSALARGYLAAHPPSTPSLRELGFRLPEYLASCPQRSVPRVAVDMAELERAYLQVFDTPDEPPLDPAEVAALAPEKWPGARLRLSGALRLLELGSRVADLRRALRARTTADLALEEQAIQLVVYRRDLGLWDKEVPRVAFDLLQSLLSGFSLGAACEEVAGRVPDAGEALDAHLGEWFADWTRLGWIRGVVLP